MYSASVEERDGCLVYRWTLDPGQTLKADTYTFAGQFNHTAGKHQSGGDTYTVTGTGKEGPVTLDGGF